MKKVLIGLLLLIFIGGVSLAGSFDSNAPLFNQQPSTSSSVSSVSSSASSVTLLVANPNRKMATFFNDSTQVLYLKFGVTSSTSSYTVQIGSGAYFEMPTPVYVGEIDGIWSSANGNCRVTELQ